MFFKNLYKSADKILSFVQKRYTKIDTKERLHDFIFNSPKNNSLQERYEAKKLITENLNVDIKNLLKISSLPGDKSEKEILDLKNHLLKYIQFTNMLDDSKIDEHNTVRCDNIGNPFLLQEDIIESLEQLEEQIKIFNQEPSSTFDAKKNTKLNNGNFYSFKK
ncbi:hypothetical protein QEN19_000038 [Hanseniaspora menglaensis]